LASKTKATLKNKLGHFFRPYFLYIIKVLNTLIFNCLKYNLYMNIVKYPFRPD